VKRDVLVTGGAGQVGIELGRAAWPDTVQLHAPDRTILDLADPDSIARVMGERPWAAVINCGAYTAVDKAETDVRRPGLSTPSRRRCLAR
jgi:dTDP-4-dehydrorhamnose reductase